MAMTAEEGLRAGLEAETAAGLQLTIRLRTAAATVIAVWTLVENRGPGRWYFSGIAIAIMLLGYLPLGLRRLGVRGAWPLYLTTAADLVLFTVAVMHPGSFDPFEVPPQIRLRYGNEQYYYLFVAGTLLLYRPALVLWTAVVAAACWSATIVILLQRPDTRSFPDAASWVGQSTETLMARMLDPHYLSLSQSGRTVVLLLVLGSILAITVRRSRRLVERQVEAERARGNLARYFSPNVVEDLARSDTTLRTTRAQSVAVLFVDLKGFTTFAATRSPDAVITLLRAFHARMVAAVFAHGGTVDKYLGDGLMVTFGTPRPGPTDATQALRCAHAMRRAMAEWNGVRVAGGEAPLRIGVGVHHGPVVLGDIGDARHLEFAVIGTTVNVASRLEALTRSLDVELAVSDAVVAAARAEGGPPEIFAGLVARGPQALPGVPAPVSAWTVASAL